LSRIEDRLAGLGLELPQPFQAPAGLELPFQWVRRSRDFAYVSGHGPLNGTEVLVKGKVGADVSADQAYDAARLTALSMLTSLKQELGELDRITGWVKALGLVNCAPGFNGTPGVINGFSDLIIDLWGESGRHARSAIGASELPFDMSVEVEAIVEVTL
jgi:enamine deaminase RidA (YjgF/YER057c/UK114 family)